MSYRLLIVLACSVLLVPVTRAATPVPLIERAKIFGNPTKTQARISPNGEWLSWIAPRDGVLNIWVAPVAHPEQAKPVTAETKRPIRQHQWAPDSSQILYVNDQGGDENFKLYSADPRTGAQRVLTPFDKTRVDILAASRRVRDRVLVSINNRDPRWQDVYSLDLASGKLDLVLKNDGYAGFVADEGLAIRLAVKSRDDGGSDYYSVEHGVIGKTPVQTVGLDDALTTAPLGYSTDGRTLYWLDSRGRDKAAIVAEDVARGRRTVAGSSELADVGDALFDPKTGRLQAYEVEYLRTEWVATDPKLRDSLAWLREHLKGEVHVTSRTDADDRWTLAVDPVSEPSANYVFEPATRHLTKLFVTRPELEGAPLVPMHPVEITARDGLKLVSYLSLPAGATLGADGHASSPVPLVLFVHGGPWARDHYGYQSSHQWLANRGYAVLSVNYRASTGFGKAFLNAGNLQWGRRMHEDLLDAVDWAVKHGVTRPDQVAIMGGSYGGYATLAGLTFTPTTFACGVDIVGPSNLQTLLKTIPPYWEAFRQQFYRRMGDPTTPEGRALLDDRSPLYKADAIVRPLLIGQGANDPRVNQAESDQIVASMVAKHIPVTYVLFPDEGHGFARPENSIAFNAVAEGFLAKCLGGRAEPIGDALARSTGKVLEGASVIPELAAGAH